MQGLFRSLQVQTSYARNALLKMPHVAKPLILRRNVVTDKQKLRAESLYDTKPLKNPPGEGNPPFIPMTFLLTDNQFYVMSVAVVRMLLPHHFSCS
jgi:hypothetical protein